MNWTKPEGKLSIWRPLVTVVTSRAAAQQRGRRRDLGAVSFKSSGDVHFFLKTPDCSFKCFIGLTKGKKASGKHL